MDFEYGARQMSQSAMSGMEGATETAQAMSESQYPPQQQQAMHQPPGG